MAVHAAPSYTFDSLHLLTTLLPNSLQRVHLYQPRLWVLKTWASLRRAAQVGTVDLLLALLLASLTMPHQVAVVTAPTARPQLVVPRMVSPKR